VANNIAYTNTICQARRCNDSRNPIITKIINVMRFALLYPPVL